MLYTIVRGWILACFYVAYNSHIGRYRNIYLSIYIYQNTRMLLYRFPKTIIFRKNVLKPKEFLVQVLYYTLLYVHCILQGVGISYWSQCRPQVHAVSDVTTLLLSMTTYFCIPQVQCKKVAHVLILLYKICDTQRVIP